MNDNTRQLIEQMAQNLGTTSEYLWSILIAQAPISATVSLVQILIIVLAWIPLYKLHRYFSGSENREPHYGDDNPVPYVVIAGGVFILGLLTIVAFFATYDVVNGFFHPEYWALQKILSAVR